MQHTREQYSWYFSSRLPTLPLDCLHLWVNDTTLGKKRGARDYTSKAVKDSYNEAQWIKTINEGIEKDGSHIMGGYKDKFTADQIKALAQYLKNI